MKKIVIFGLAVAVILAIFLSPFASKYPDGLEKVAEKLGFISHESSVIKSPLPDYTFPLVKNEKLTTSLAGLAGTIFVFIFTIFVAKLISKIKK